MLEAARFSRVGQEVRSVELFDIHMTLAPTSRVFCVSTNSTNYLLPNAKKSQRQTSKNSLVYNTTISIQFTMRLKKYIFQ